MRVARLLHSFALVFACLIVSAFADRASAATMQITEWMYDHVNSPGEFVEFTNMSGSAIDMTGWSFDDNTQTPGSESLSAFGLVNSGESVIITEVSAADFRAAWGLSDSVKVIGGIANNLGRSDEINLFNGTTLVDRLTYNDQGSGAVKGPRTQGVSGRASTAGALGANNASAWVLSTVGDVEGSYKSLAFGTLVGGDIGSPGKTSFAAPVPLPAAAYLLLSGCGLLGALRRKR